MLTIRLQRVGKKKFATYRIIISEKGRDTHDKYLEQLGTYNPHAKENQFQPVADRVKFWIEKGATTSDTIHNLLVKNGVIKGDKKKSVYLTKKRKTKLGEKKKAEEDAKKAAAEKAAAEKAAAEEAKRAEAEAAKAAAEAAKAAEEAVKAEPAPEAAPEAPAQEEAAPAEPAA